MSEGADQELCIDDASQMYNAHRKEALHRAMRVRGFVWNTLYALGLVVVISQAAQGGAAQALPTSFIHSEVYSLPTPPPQLPAPFYSGESQNLKTKCALA